MTIDVETKYNIGDVIVAKRHNRYIIGLITGITIYANNDEGLGDIKFIHHYKAIFDKTCSPAIVSNDDILFKLCDTTIERIKDIRGDLGGGSQS